MRITAGVAADEPDPNPSDNVATTDATAVYAPRVAISRPLAPPGSVVTVFGSGFPAGAQVTLGWQPGLGRATLRATAAGDFPARHRVALE